MAVIIGIDIGGTFTDVVAVDTSSGELLSAKSLTTYGDEGRGVLNCLEELGVNPASLERLVHGTTIGTNAILERRGTRTALLTTRGFRDLLEIGRTRRMVPNTLFDLNFRRPESLVPRPWRFDVDERMLSSGEVLEPLNAAQLGQLVSSLSSAQIQSVAICFLHAYANPKHELLARDIVQAQLPGVSVSLSHEVVPEYREYERMTTTVLNAYIAPLLAEYLDNLADRLAEMGSTGRIFVMASNGGTMSIQRAKAFPVQTILSGPAGGVVAAMVAAKNASIRHFITYDMGGTSSDVSMVRDMRPRLSLDNLITGIPLKVLQVDIHTVGAGGGSIAWLDDSNQLHVGPRSAGSRPGPVCYGRGGSEITVTDANLMLGRLAERRKLGGKIAPDRDLVAPLMTELAERLAINDPYRMADGIVRIAVAKMVASIREISIARGHDPRECALIAFGGAGPMHATQVADELGMRTVVVPPYAGSFSALGLLTSDIRYDVAETVLAPNTPETMDRLAKVFERLIAQAVQRLVADGFAAETLEIERSLDLRYKGQAFELNLTLKEEGADSSELDKRFTQIYLAAYGHSNEGDLIEIVNARVASIARTAKPLLRAKPTGKEPLIERRTVWIPDRQDDVPVYDRAHLSVGQMWPGPAVIEETGSTTVVFPKWSVRRDVHDNLILERTA